MALQPADEITGLRRAWSEGDESALDLLMPLGVHPRVAVANWTLGVVVAAMALVFAWRLGANLSRLPGWNRSGFGGGTLRAPESSFQEFLKCPNQARTAAVSGGGTQRAPESSFQEFLKCPN